MGPAKRPRGRGIRRGLPQGHRQDPDRPPLVRHVAVDSVRLGAEKAKSLDGPKLALAMEGMELPPDVALSRARCSTAPATTS